MTPVPTTSLGPHSPFLRTLRAMMPFLFFLTARTTQFSRLSRPSPACGEQPHFWRGRSRVHWGVGRVHRGAPMKPRRWLALLLAAALPALPAPVRAENPLAGELASTIEARDLDAMKRLLRRDPDLA